jgi:glycosyltransferase involved in cell wall biosynthesis
MLDELVKYEHIEIALAFPVNSISIQKSKETPIQLYGLPDVREKNIFRKAYKNLTHTPENYGKIKFVPEVISDFNPDIIQIFGSENPFGLIVSQQKIPVIIHIQGFLTVWHKKWFAGISKLDQLRYARLKDLILMHGVLNEFYTFGKRAGREREILKQCRYFSGRTSFDKRVTALLSPGSTYFHCEEFIRKEFFEVHWEKPLGKVVKCISTLKGTTYKGIELLVETFSILREYTSYSFEIRICGVSENEDIIGIIKKRFKREFSKLNIKFLGKLSSDLLIKELMDSNLYINPSYIENSPNSVCEAMVLGMPVISTNVGGISSLINDGVEGILVQEGEPYSMAGAVIELVNDYNFARSLGQNARKRATKRHYPPAIADRLIEIYEAIQ